MPVSSVTVEKAMNAAEALADSPLEVVYAAVPTFERAEELHPLIGAIEHIGQPFTFHKFGLAAEALDRHKFAVRLTPPEGRTVGVPIIRQRDERVYAGLPRYGFAALRAEVESSHGNKNPFALFGETAEGGEQALDMPNLESETRLIEIVSGQIMKIAFTAINDARRRQLPSS